MNGVCANSLRALVELFAVMLMRCLPHSTHMIGDLTDVAVVHIPGTRDVANDFATDLRDLGLNIETEESDFGPFAGVEWLLPAAISVWLADKYFGTILSEAAKGHYAVAKAALNRLVSQTTGPDRQVRISVIGSPGKLKNTDPAVLGFYAALKSGQRVKFVFEHDLAPGARDAAIQSMHETMADHYLRYPHDGLTSAVSVTSLAKERLVVLRFDSAQDAWNPWRPAPPT
jgi:hypothetical protein